MVRAEDNFRGNWGVARRWGVRALVAGCASWFAWLVISQSGRRSAYSPDASVWSDFQYPTLAVVFTVALIAAEAFLVELLLHYRASRYLWRRALLGGVALVPLSAIAINLVMDLPPYHAIHLLWIVVVNVILAVIAVASGVLQLMQATVLGRR
jgi:hypothetical protein